VLQKGFRIENLKAPVAFFTAANARVFIKALCSKTAEFYGMERACSTFFGNVLQPMGK
jgi:hypothetical protein